MVKTSPFNAGVTSSIPGQGVAAAAAAKSLQSCPTLCDPIDGSPSGSTVPGILQAKTLQCLTSKKQNIEQKQCCSKFNEDFKNGPQFKKKKI